MMIGSMYPKGGDMERDFRSEDRQHEKDLTAGPTPEVRRAEGHAEDGEEVDRGPTPEIREAEERAKKR